MLEDDVLDRLLDQTAPAVGHDAGCVACRSAVRRRRPVPRRVGWTLAVALVGCAGVGTAAAHDALPRLTATFGDPDRTAAQETSNGHTCGQAFRAEGQPTDPAVLPAASEILAGMDLDSLDVESAARKLRRQLANAEWDDPNTTPPTYTVAFFESQALNQAAFAQLREDLAMQGFSVKDMVGLEMEGTISCDTELTK